MTHPTPLPAVDADVAAIREALAAKPTPGPYRVITDEIPHKLGGTHKERRIFTTWDHPQLKGPLGVVNHSFGLGAKDGDPAVHMVAISEADAAYIAACSPDRLERILTALTAAQARAEAVEKDAARYRWLRDEGRFNSFSVEQERPGWVTTHSATTLDAAIDSAIGGKGA